MSVEESDFSNEFIADPYELFKKWFQKALESSIANPAAFSLATIGLDQKPKLRTLLYKGLAGKDFCFYSNYNSPKGQELEQNPNSSMLFYWRPPLDLQVRIEGHVRRMSHEESDAYFQTRPKGSRLAALASPQSEKIPNRKFLDERFDSLEQQFKTSSPKCPKHWGGYYFQPDRFEFMILQEYRLHDRVEYNWIDESWQRQRLAP